MWPTDEKTKIKEYFSYSETFLSFCGAWKYIVTVFLLWMEKKSVNILQNILFVFHREQKVTQVWNDMDMEKGENSIYFGLF